MGFSIRHGWKVLAGLAVLAVASGCVSEPREQTDTFGGANYPSPAEIISGRFEHNPPEFYEARIARLRSHGVPTELGTYEAVATALDHLGRFGDAIFALKSQAALMHRPDSPATE